MNHPDQEIVKNIQDDKENEEEYEIEVDCDCEEDF